MVTYLYWLSVIGLAGAAFFLIGWRLRQWGAGAVVAIALLGIFSLMYYFYFQQVFVKRWGGVMSVSVPKGQRHISLTWKEDNIWIENYDPETNTCIFQEYARGNILQGRVLIKDCNPLTPR
jgi:hypothetical protein